MSDELEKRVKILQEEVIKHKPVEYAEAINKYIEYNNYLDESFINESIIFNEKDIYYSSVL